MACTWTWPQITSHYIQSHSHTDGGGLLDSSYSYLTEAWLPHTAGEDEAPCPRSWGQTSNFRTNSFRTSLESPALSDFLVSPLFSLRIWVWKLMFSIFIFKFHISVRFHLVFIEYVVAFIDFMDSNNVLSFGGETDPKRHRSPTIPGSWSHLNRDMGHWWLMWSGRRIKSTRDKVANKSFNIMSIWTADYYMVDKNL